MELTYTDAQELLQKRFNERPEISALISKPEFENTLEEIIEYTKIDVLLLPIIKYELLVVLAFYAPLDELSQNISESTGIDIEKSDKLVLLIDALLLGDIHDELEEFQRIWKNELKRLDDVPKTNSDVREKSELRSENVVHKSFSKGVPAESAAKPLTREDVLNALASKRTMASDIESVKSTLTVREE